MKRGEKKERRSENDDLNAEGGREKAIIGIVKIFLLFSFPSYERKISTK